jgi:hypothetical protein
MRSSERKVNGNIVWYIIDVKTGGTIKKFNSFDEELKELSPAETWGIEYIKKRWLEDFDLEKWNDKLLDIWYLNYLKIYEPEKVYKFNINQLKNNSFLEKWNKEKRISQELFKLLEENNAKDIIDTVIEKSLLIKKQVVEEDEKETGLRKVLNFGHTIGHAIETVTGLNELYHGECVALGMMFMASGEAKERIKNLLSKNNLPTKTNFNVEAVYEALHHDKKSAGTGVNVVTVKNIGEFEFEFLEYNEIYKILKGEK